MTPVLPRPLLGACALAVATLVLPAAAATPGRSDCGAKDPQLSIAGCTLVIDDRRTVANMRVNALGMRGIARHKSGDLTGARADFTAVLAAWPQDHGTLILRGTVNADLGHYDEAIADYSAALAIDPQNVNALMARALAYDHGHDYDRAITDLSLAVILAPGDPTPVAARALAFVQKNDFVHALEDLDAAIRLNPKDATYYVSRGDLRERTGDHDGAIADATAAIELAPDRLHAYFNRAKAYQARARGSVVDDLKKALADYDVVMRLKPDHDFLAWVLGRRGLVHHALGEFDAAITDFTLLLGVDSTATRANVERARAYAAKGDFTHAVADYDVALKKWPTSAKLLAWRAEAAAKLAQTP